MTGIVLAGGKSRRMGTDKAQLAWEEGTLLSAAVGKLEGLCREIIVVGAKRGLPYPVVWTADRVVGAGPLAGLEAGLDAASFDATLVLACDMPLVSAAFLQTLSASAAAADVVLPWHAGGYEPLCAWYRRSACLPVVKQLLQAGEARMQSLLPLVRTVAISPDKDGYDGIAPETFFFNVNTKADYERAMLVRTTPHPGAAG